MKEDEVSVDGGVRQALGIPGCFAQYVLEQCRCRYHTKMEMEAEF
jgi:hypothetical protein